MFRKYFKEIFSEKELDEMTEILEFNIGKEIDYSKLQEKIALSDFFHSKLLRYILKLKLVIDQLEVEYEKLKAEEVHEIAFNYDGLPELLKNSKDYERELNRIDEMNDIKLKLKRFKSFLDVLEKKIKELENINWHVKNIIEFEKLKNGLL
jgi:hypothetical protein